MAALFKKLTRAQLARFLPDPDLIRAFEALQDAVANGGSGGAGITQLTGDVLAGPGTGSVAATLASIFAGGSFTNASITVDAKGRITAASSGAGGSGTVTSVNGSGGTTGLTVSGGPIVGAGTLTLGGTLIAANGGTGQSSYTAGDLLYASGAAALSKLAAVAAGSALVSAGIGAAPVWGSYVGRYWAEATFTASPNNVIGASQLTPVSGLTDADAVITPKGNGAFQMQVADGANPGGSKRGTNAIDLQFLRSAGSQVASGTRSIVGGGSNNTASGTTSGTFAGSGNAATTTNAVVLGGTANQATASAASVLAGSSNSSSGSSSISGGDGSSATQQRAVAIGGACAAGAVDSWAIGNNATSRAIIGAFAWGSNQSGAGRQQSIRLIERRLTANATPTVLTCDAGGASTTNQLIMPAGMVEAATFLVVAKNTTSGDGAWFYYVGACKNVGGTVTLVGTPVLIASGSDAAMAACSAAIGADNTNKAISVTVTGIAATNLAWAVLCTSMENNT